MKLFYELLVLYCFSNNNEYLKIYNSQMANDSKTLTMLEKLPLRKYFRKTSCSFLKLIKERLVKIGKNTNLSLIYCKISTKKL